ncbi:hypothetical protein [Neorhodopirellula lusitana]|uniref:hypothetical protein n=1 Tax=Neorhodopirellula lusitana TaxID=445327 RepID=UPI003850BE46
MVARWLGVVGFALLGCQLLAGSVSTGRLFAQEHACGPDCYGHTEGLLGTHPGSLPELPDVSDDWQADQRSMRSMRPPGYRSDIGSSRQLSRRPYAMVPQPTAFTPLYSDGAERLSSAEAFARREWIQRQRSFANPVTGLPDGLPSVQPGRQPSAHQYLGLFPEAEPRQTPPPISEQPPFSEQQQFQGGQQPFQGGQRTSQSHSHRGCGHRHGQPHDHGPGAAANTPGIDSSGTQGALPQPMMQQPMMQQHSVLPPGFVMPPGSTAPSHQRQPWPSASPRVGDDFQSMPQPSLQSQAPQAQVGRFRRPWNSNAYPGRIGASRQLGAQQGSPSPLWFSQRPSLELHRQELSHDRRLTEERPSGVLKPGSLMIEGKVWSL